MSVSLLCPGNSLHDTPLWAFDAELVVLLNAAIRIPVVRCASARLTNEWRWAITDREGWDRLRDNVSINSWAPTLWSPDWIRVVDDAVYDGLTKLRMPMEAIRKAALWAGEAGQWEFSSMTRVIVALVEERLPDVETRRWKQIDIFGCDLSPGGGYYGTDLVEYGTRDRWSKERGVYQRLVRLAGNRGVKIRRV